jgi:hypothetical protein
MKSSAILDWLQFLCINLNGALVGLASILSTQASSAAKTKLVDESSSHIEQLANGTSAKQQDTPSPSQIGSAWLRVPGLGVF